MPGYETAKDVALIRAYCSVTSEPFIGRSMDGRIRRSCESLLRGTAAGGYNVATAYREDQIAYEEDGDHGKRWTHAMVFEILKTQFGGEFNPEIFHRLT
ncbi:hypothetical protein C5167_011645 [Papaver somniferum]|uniref:Uncharacterized protein n=1 Tax=Papaver somniferum TaxID=3469 RepID=A0A4Y7K7H9_PAPSO|nr:hypothetical protein C5167_011645 [Papaver somniferum]